MKGQEKEFLGTGWKFPVTVDQSTGRIQLSYEEDNIRESIYIILMTKPGERMMQPEFGCRIHEYLFQRADHSVLVQIEQTVRDSLLRWEPRIRDIQVKANAHTGSDQVTVQISYRVRSTNNPYNLVFPFFMNEGFGGYSRSNR